ncbi:MAG TPA: hypothetical protein VMS89_08180 [Methanoregulaceae archaeon]|nr:hypothetical protein [Methanoregulaceae archaeon]
MVMLELFTNMMKEEWRLHSTMFGSISFALFPVLIFVIVLMGSFLLPLFRAILPGGDLALIVTGSFILLGIMVGGFGLLGNEVMNRRFGQASLLVYSSRSLPIPERTIFFNFVVKDIVYYLILWVLPFAAGFTAASPFTGVSLLTCFLLTLSLTLSFLTGLSVIFFLSTLYSRSKLLLAIVLATGLMASLGLLSTLGMNGFEYFPPLLLFRHFSYGMLLVACVLVAVPFTLSIFLFSPEFTGRVKKYRNMIPPVAGRLSFFPAPPLAAKDLIDLWRSGGGIGQMLFSFLLPLGLVWFFLAVLGNLVPTEDVLLVFVIVTGIISATMYTWLTSFDSFSSYACLPISVSTLITSKICSFTVLQAIPLVFVAMVTVTVSGAGYLVPSLVLWCSVTFYALSVTIFLTGLSPNVLVYDVKVLLAFLVLTGIPVMTIIGLLLLNPYYALASAFLGIPAWILVHAGYHRWDRTDIATF